MNHLKYIPNFDGIRCLAVIFVLLSHWGYGIFKGGWIGVDLFFVLSGYLITYILNKEYILSGKVSLRKFYARRALRLYPALIIFVIMANLLWIYIQKPIESNQLLATVSGLLYFTDCIDVKFLGPMSHLWSLSVEENFYLFWPVIVSGFIFCIPFRSRVIILIVLILFVFLFRIWVYNSSYNLVFNVFKIDPYYFAICRADTILMGCLLALLETNGKLKEMNYATAHVLLLLSFLSLTVILISLSSENSYWLNGGFVLTNLLCLFVILISLKAPNSPLLANSVVRWIGIRSYGIYLYHVPFFDLMEVLRQENNVINLFFVTILRFVITFILADLSFRFIEQPIQKFRKKYTIPFVTTSIG